MQSPYHHRVDIDILDQMLTLLLVCTPHPIHVYSKSQTKSIIPNDMEMDK